MDFSENENIAISPQDLGPENRLKSKDDVVLSQGLVSHDVLLSFAQQRIWFLEQLTPGSPANHISEGLFIKGSLQLPALQRSLNLVLQRHQILRTSFEEKSGIPVQTVLPSLKVQIKEFDLREDEEPAQKRKIEEITREDTHERFDLANPPLIRLTLIRTGLNEARLLLTTHRIVADRASIRLIFGDLLDFYLIISKGGKPRPNRAPQFGSFAKRQRSTFKSPQVQNQKKYWLDLLHRAPFALALPMDRTRPAVQTFNGAILTVSPENELFQQLLAFCIKHRISSNSLFLTIFEILLHRYTREEDFLIGCQSPCRKFPETESLIGVLENIFVHRADLSGDPTVSEVLMHTKTAALNSLANQDFPFEKLVEELQLERTLSHSPLVQVMFKYSLKEEVSYYGELSVEQIRTDNATVRHDLTLEIEEDAAQIMFTWKYNTDLFENQTIERMSGHFLTLLDSVLKNPNQNISRLDILTPQEREQLLKKWNETESKFPENRRLEELFQEQVELAPKSIAVISGKKQLTYRELDYKSNQLAHYLIRKGIGREKVVALFMDRSIEMCITLLAIIKSGACYLPIDPAYPADRVEFMLQDSRASAILTQNSLRSKLNQSIPIICVDSDWINIGTEKKDRPPLQGDSRDVIYIIYTSGSTGIPKGVMVTHRNLVNQACGIKKLYELRPDDRVLQFASISFDVAGEELYSAWLTGSTVVLRTEQMMGSFQTFLTQVENLKISFLNLPTAFWQELVQEIQTTDIKIPSCIRAIVVGGEKVSYPVYKQWLNIVENSVLFFNGYGPTETTITSTVYKDSIVNRKTADRIQDLPIGKPIANTLIYVLDQNMQPVPVGVPGELWIGGEGVSCGYLNRPELTTTRFIPDPFENNPDRRVYKTGDLVRYLTDGNLQFFGRVDDQVKIRGFRIELGEIESALLKHPSVREAAVTAPVLAGSARLIAFVVCDNESITSRELRDFLNSKLPDYMIPSGFILLESLPHTASGKIDRRNLPLPESLDGEIRKNYVPPRDELELKLTGIWQNLLNVEKVGINDNFFELGGHSLLAVRLFSQVEKETGKNLPLATLFEAPTIAELAAILKQEGWSARWSSLVPIQPNGDRPPFFCIHAVGGNVVGYQPLAEYLSKDQPLYGLQARGLDGKEKPHLNLEEMAADYIREIKTVQPNGPYHLGGLSSGGTVAFEMARQLFEQGDEIGVLALFDTDAPTYLKIISFDDSITVDQWSAYKERIQYHLRNLFSKEWKTYLKKKYKTIKRRASERFKHTNLKIHKKIGKPLPETLLRVQEATAYAVNDYHPGYFPGDITLFMAMQQGIGQVRLDIGWKPFARSVKVFKVPGDHLGILKEPNIRTLATGLQQFIDDFSMKIEKRTGILVSLLFTAFQMV